MSINRIDFLNALKAIAIIGVIVIHINAQLITDVSQMHLNYGPHDERVFYILSYLTRYCVPIFIMVTGYLYWNIDVNVSVRRVAHRLAVTIGVYLIWSMVYTLPQHTGQENFYSLFVLGKSAPQMYYIPLIYIPTIILINTARRISYTPLCVGISFLLCLLVNYSHIIKGPLQSTGFVLAYAFLGASYNYFRDKSLNRKLLLFASLAGILVFAIHSIPIVHGQPNWNSYFGYFQPTMMIYSFSIFSLFFLTRKSIPKIVDTIGDKSMTIYLQHWIVFIYLYSFWRPLALYAGFGFYPLLILLYGLVILIPLLLNNYKWIFKIR